MRPEDIAAASHGHHSFPFTHPRPASPKRAFTLIEVLVVVAIIALLVAILMPSLAAARIQAKLTLDKANSRQIGTMTAQYHTVYNTFVPIVYNYYANGHNAHDAPARACWLSVALRGFHAAGARLRIGKGQKFCPDDVWYPEFGWFKEYEKTMLPDYFVCPFSRAKGPGEVYINETPYFRYYQWIGRHEHYQTWLWTPIITRGERVDNKVWPGENKDISTKSVAKHSALTWNRVTGGAVANETKYKYELHRKWSLADCRKVKSASLADVTVVFCAQGEHLVLQRDSKIGRVNVGGHPAKMGVGGTHAIFADTHVDWVEGRRIGWP
ncbi:MAG: type II secretion system protein [Planctomycetes bacterium]|nr:type II secretion system protein [Planctomycetota bacterium]